ncbi:MAG: trypsin-like peptidase domain-containing protein [Bdellovibrio sp.]|nr:trypsin-like peptidase domain-containing protein [Bdellovibrio sp.]
MIKKLKKLEEFKLLFAVIFSLLMAISLCAYLTNRTFVLNNSNASQNISSTGASGLEANIFVKPAKKVVPSVVNITTLTTMKSPFGYGGQEDYRKFFEDFFKHFGGRGFGPDDDEEYPQKPPAPKKGPKERGGPKAMALGTGFIVDASGLILTNNHVVAGVDEIKIQFTEETDEKPTAGEVVGRDTELDLALIRVKSKKQMTPVALGDSDSLEIGEYVFAVGNPFGQGHTVTHGIISAKVRNLPGFTLANHIQTDAPINPGNSGGPLCNLMGEVIGINNAIDARAQGIGFAIPINLVKKVLPQLKTKGSVSRGYIGVQIIELTPEISKKLGLSKDLQAPLVADVYSNGPADEAGIKPYDVIIEFNNKTVKTQSELIAEVTSVPVGSQASIKINRSGEVKEFKIKIAERPNAEKLAEKDKQPKKKGGPTRLDMGMELEDVSKKLAKEFELPEKLQGAIVTHIESGSPAEKAGLARGDAIVEVDQKPVKDVESFYAIVKDKKSYLLRVRRSDSRGREGYSVIILDLKQD